MLLCSWHLNLLLCLFHPHLTLCFFSALVQTIQKQIKPRVAHLGVSSPCPFPRRSFTGWFPRSTCESSTEIGVVSSRGSNVKGQSLSKSGNTFRNLTCSGRSQDFRWFMRKYEQRANDQGWRTDCPSLEPDLALWAQKGRNHTQGVHRATLAARKCLQARCQLSLLGTSLSTSRFPK